MTKRFSPPVWLLVVFSIAALLVACNKDKYDYPVHDPYPGMYVPHYFALQNKDVKALEVTKFSIDHFNKHIYNAIPLPYKTELDSADLHMFLSVNCKVQIKNLSTGGVQNWDPGKAAKDKKKLEKVEIKGGALEMTIQAPEKVGTTTYKVDVNVYAYDPHLLTWQKSSNALPVRSADAQFFKHAGKLYFLAAVPEGQGFATKIFEVESLKQNKLSLRNVEQGPNAPLPHSIRKDANAAYWAMGANGGLLHSKDLLHWDKVKGLDGLKLSSLLYDANIDGDKAPLSLLFVAKAAGADYGIYAFNGSEATLKTTVRADFPVKGMLIHTYDVAGVRRANLIGGSTAAGETSEKMFFSSDGTDWGSIDYRAKGFDAPAEGATLFALGRKLYLVGGRLSNGKFNEKIYLSVDHGATWIKLGEKQGPDEHFEARTGLAGVAVMEDGDEAYYLYAGAVNNKPTADVWRGYVKKN